MSNIIQHQSLVQRHARMREIVLSLAALIAAGGGTAASVSWIGAHGWNWAGRGVSQTKTRSFDADQLLTASLCVANPDSAAMRFWIAKYPKSPRGRLNHQRSNAATAL